MKDTAQVLAAPVVAWRGTPGLVALFATSGVVFHILARWLPQPAGAWCDIASLASEVVAVLSITGLHLPHTGTAPHTDEIAAAKPTVSDLARLVHDFKNQLAVIGGVFGVLRLRRVCTAEETELLDYATGAHRQLLVLVDSLLPTAEEPGPSNK